MNMASIETLSFVASMIVVDACHNPLTNRTFAVDHPKAAEEVIRNKRHFPIIVLKTRRPSHAPLSRR